MPISWTADADAKLLTTILRVHNVKVDHATVAKEMSKIYETDITTSSIENRVRKIKGNKGGTGPLATTKVGGAGGRKKKDGSNKNGSRITNGDSGDNEADASTLSSPSTPQGRKRKAGGAPDSSVANSINDSGEANHDEETKGSPAIKKVKSEPEEDEAFV